MSRPSYLITGGAGFIGSHLAEHCLDQGAAVTVLDDLSTGRWQNLEACVGRTGFRALVASAEDYELLEREIPKHDFVFHLASVVGVKLVVRRPVHTINTLVRSTDAVFSLCSKYRVPALLTSTSEVYGKATGVSFAETDDVVLGSTDKRRWAYACGKMLDEFLAMAYHTETGLPVYVARLFNVVGPRQVSDYGMVLPTFVRQAVRNDPITIYGTGRQKRCFCSVHDVVPALVRLSETPEASGQVINLGSDEEIGIEDLARRVREMARSGSELKYVPYEEAYGPNFDDMSRRVPDLTRARELIGWRPRTSLEEVIRELIARERPSSQTP